MPPHEHEHDRSRRVRMDFNDRTGELTITIPVRIVRQGVPQDALPEREIAEALLTARQIQVFSMLVEGKVNKEIANELGISVSTVKLHVVNILEKLHMVTRVEIMRRFHLRPPAVPPASRTRRAGDKVSVNLDQRKSDGEATVKVEI
jgi:DNA-binding CsgD family transcriptional regulator